MYRSAVTGKFYGIIIGKDGRVEQWELMDDGSGQVTGQVVRQFAVGSQSEGSVADDELGYLYISEENVGIWKYSAEPDGGTQRTLVDSTDPGGHLTADAEGLAIYRRPNGQGYLLASSQGNSRYTVYRRESCNEYLATFQISGGPIDGTSATDGIEVANMSLGSRYPLGLLVVHDDQNEGSTQNFKFVGWDEIANRLGLAIDTRVDLRTSAM
jgi:3-phytase